MIGEERVLGVGSRPSPTGDAEKAHPAARRGNQMGRRTPDDAVGWMTVIPDAQALERHCDCGRRRVSKSILPQTEARAPEKGFAGLFRVRNSGGQQFEHRKERSFGGIRVVASASRGFQPPPPFADTSYSPPP